MELRPLEETLRLAAGFCRRLYAIERAHLTSDEEQVDELLSTVDLGDLRRVADELELQSTVRHLPRSILPPTAAGAPDPLAAVAPLDVWNARA